MKIAILQVADTGPAESLAMMLRAVGYRCLTPNEELLRQLRELGCDTVLSNTDLVRGMGYEALDTDLLGEARPSDMGRCDLYIDVKAHRNLAKIVIRWPRLQQRTAWYRINGGQPEHVKRKCSVCNGKGMLDKVGCLACNRTGVGEDCGDEVNPPCPVLTPNQWYKSLPRAYAFWPPMYRKPVVSRAATYDRPVCLVHNLAGWGYGRLIAPMQKLHVRMFGRGSPDGLISCPAAKQVLSRAVAMVHLKSNDAPGYALLEAIAAGCPIICTRRLIWRCKMQDLLIPGETCLAFDRETHEELSDADVVSCAEEVTNHLALLSNTLFNVRFASHARSQYDKVVWRDEAGLTHFLQEHFA